MLRHNLLSQLNLFVYKSLLVLPVREVVVPVHRSRPHFDVISLAIGLPDFERVYDSLNSFLSQLLFSSDSFSLASDHSLLVFLGHVFLVCNGLVQLIPVVFLACVQEILSKSCAQDGLLTISRKHNLLINERGTNYRWLLNLIWHRFDLITFGRLLLVFLGRIARLLQLVVFFLWVDDLIVIVEQPQC